MLLREMSLSQLMHGATSNITNKWRDDRAVNSQSKEVFVSAHLYQHKDLLELVFNAEGTSDDQKLYTIVFRFYGVMKLLSNQFANLPDSQKKGLLQKVFNTCDCKMSSTDPSWKWQGMFEDMAKMDMSIFRYNLPKGKNIWHDRHAGVGGLRNPSIRVTKHMDIVITDILGHAYDQEIISNLQII